MVDYCRLNTSVRLNFAKCIVDIPLNTSFCVCRSSCYGGNNCERFVGKRPEIDSNYVYLIISIIGLCFSILNNSLSLELCISCRRIRRTNCGIYLIVYSILAIVASTFQTANEAVRYYPNQLINNEKRYKVFECYVSKIGYNALIYLCIWMSSCVAFERSLVICFNGKMNANRWRSLITTIGLFALAVGCVTPLLQSNCNWDHPSRLYYIREFFTYFYNITGIIIYVVATLVVLISFTRRIRRYGRENGSFIKTFLKLLYTHLFIFVPPIAYGIAYIPYAIAYPYSDKPGYNYLGCHLSVVEYIIRVLMQALQGIPFIITWLLFVYPSKVYMTEFYLNTWSGQRLAKILLFCKSYNSRNTIDFGRTANLTNNEHDNRELHCEN